MPSNGSKWAQGASRRPRRPKGICRRRSIVAPRAPTSGDLGNYEEPPEPLQQKAVWRIRTLIERAKLGNSPGSRVIDSGSMVLNPA